MMWLKTLDIRAGSSTRTKLIAGEHTLDHRRRSPNPQRVRQPKQPVTFSCSNEEAHANPALFASIMRGEIPARARRPSSAAPVMQAGLRHGSNYNAGELAYVLLESDEHRNLELEQAAKESHGAAATLADWLAENQDPFASPLRAMLAGQEFSTRETWWLEGINRGRKALGAKFKMSGGFLREAELRGSTLDLDQQLLHLLTLRVCALEHLTILINMYLPATYWAAFGSLSYLAKYPWPPSLQTIRICDECGTGPELETAAGNLSETLLAHDIKVEPGVLDDY